MKWLQNVIIFFLTVLVYLHIFIHFKVNPENEFFTIDDIHKENIASATYYKLPFIFDGTSIIKPVDLKQCIKKNKDKKDKTYTKLYEPIPLLEPNMIGVSTTDTIYEVKQDKSFIETNLECLNYYMIHSGKVQVYCVHPKYKEHLQHINIDSSDFLENENILKVELHPNSILFVPNYWYVCMKSKEEKEEEKKEKEKEEEKHEKCIVEKIQYKTPLNHLNFYYNYAIHYLK